MVEKISVMERLLNEIVLISKSITPMDDERKKRIADNYFFKIGKQYCEENITQEEALQLLGEVQKLLIPVGVAMLAEPERFLNAIKS